MGEQHWLWSNVPIPRAYLAALLPGGALHLFLGLELLHETWIGHALGWPALATGFAVAAWCVSTAAGVDVAQPSAIVVDGPYRVSRNPMYLAWTFLGVGMALVANSVWMIVATLAATLYTHFVTIPREEGSMAELFGDEYAAYTTRVRRWL
ncbi:MAG: isoprenylcysteine carboxylmethyltransferase family protein [Myxococcales bacterium]|nr:isoprenylcysteine carboxylmethyltransferase family protein [Myxococcales bacterium]